MEKRLPFVCVALGCALGGLAACSDKKESTFPEETVDTGFVSPPGSFAVDAGRDAGDGGKIECKPGVADTYVPAWTAPTAAAACSAADLAAYYETCIASLGADGGATACEAWRTDAAHGTCAACIEPADGSGPIQWHRDRYYQTLNVAGCIAIQQAALGAGDCGGVYHAAVQCKRDACDACFDTEGATFKDFQACQSAAGSLDACASYESAVGTACAGYKDAGSPALECFPRGGEGQAAHFVRVMGITCGATRE